MKNYLKVEGYSQIPTLSMSKKYILNNLLIENKDEFNINIY